VGTSEDEDGREDVKVDPTVEYLNHLRNL
jgi:hypothetical protein